MARVGAAAALLAALCSEVAAKGTAYRGGASAAGGSGAYRTHSTGYVGGSHYYVGGAMMMHHSRYHGDRDYGSYRGSRSEEWRRNHPQRPGTNCTVPAYGMQRELTQAWVITQLVFDKPMSNFTPAEIEVDFFNDLMFRSPCEGPTEVVTLFTCSFPGPLNRTKKMTDAERLDTSKCLFNGDVQSLPAGHAAARRRLLQTEEDEDSYTVVEFAMGALDRPGSTELIAAAKEIAADTEGPLQQYYNIQPAHAEFTVLDVDTAALLRPLASAVLGMALIFALF
eukprot:TRINITY_DN2256_c0_g1_i1.p2 TRINITY_DN2256_c0_g1~~TRINITY_DN2256_c0_g1_i1.p2  ORF type:complete len:281 (+),score=89.89 TRINITY_DN2256_c0_g1_i1:1551-2393(+)